MLGSVVTVAMLLYAPSVVRVAASFTRLITEHTMQHIAGLLTKLLGEDSFVSMPECSAEFHTLPYADRACTCPVVQTLQSRGRKLPTSMLQLMALIEKEGPAFAKLPLSSLTGSELSASIPCSGIVLMPWQGGCGIMREALCCSPFRPQTAPPQTLFANRP